MERVLPIIEQREKWKLEKAQNRTKPDITPPSSSSTERLCAIPMPVLVGGGLLLFALTLYAVKRAYECVYAKKLPEQTENVFEKNQPDIVEEEL